MRRRNETKRRKAKGVRVQDYFRFFSPELLLVCATTLLLLLFLPACLLLSHPMTWTLWLVSLYIYACILLSPLTQPLLLLLIYYYYYHYHRHRHHHHPTPPLVRSYSVDTSHSSHLIRSRLIHYGHFFLVFFLSCHLTHAHFSPGYLFSHRAHTHPTPFLPNLIHYWGCHYERDSLW